MRYPPRSRGASPFRLRCPPGKSVPDHSPSRRKCRWPTRTQKRRQESSRVWGTHPGPHPGENAARRPVVAVPAHHVPGLHVLHRLRDDPGVHGLALLLRAVPLAVLLALSRRLRQGLLGLRRALRVVAPVGGADRADLPAGLPAHLLLLPQGLLPVVLAEPARVRGRRAAHDLQRRDPAAADPEQHPPLLLVRRGGGRADPQLRHGAHLPRRRRRLGAHGAGIPRVPGQHRLHLALHALLPLLPPHRRRPAAALQQAPGALQGVDVRLPTEQPARPLRLGVAVLGRHRRPLRAAAVHRGLRRPRFF